jgi:hypothetical protein
MQHRRPNKPGQITRNAWDGMLAAGTRPSDIVGDVMTDLARIFTDVAMAAQRINEEVGTGPVHTNLVKFQCGRLRDAILCASIYHDMTEDENCGSDEMLTIAIARLQALEDRMEQMALEMFEQTE